MKGYQKPKTLRNLAIAGLAIYIVAWRVSASVHIIQTKESLWAFLASIKNFLVALFEHPFDFTGAKFGSTFMLFLILAFIAFMSVSGDLVKKWNLEGIMKKKELDAKNPVRHTKPKVDKMAAQNLDEMIGLGNVKEEVKKIIAYYHVQRQRKLRGMTYSPLNLNLVFYGNPGTGKTVVARYIAKTLKKNHILSKGHIVEADRATMVSQYGGGTSALVHDVVEQALGGVLFVDEAYTLTRHGDQAGQEAVDTLLKLMEDFKEDLVVIVAGYDDLMNEFVESNPGLKSRFTKHLHFPDYNAEDLTKIFNLIAEKRDYRITQGAQERIQSIFEGVVQNKGTNFSNARLVRNIFEQIAEQQALRLGIKRWFIPRKLLAEIREEDIQSFIDALADEH
ncbi:AAA family ATPase [Treponema sp. R6D11]